MSDVPMDLLRQTWVLLGVDLADGAVHQVVTIDIFNSNLGTRLIFFHIIHSFSRVTKNLACPPNWS